MVIPTQGPVSFSELQTEFGGANPISASEYYRGGANVPVGKNTQGIPASGEIQLSNFRGKTPIGDVLYVLIGGGGAGGFGVDNGGEQYIGTFGQSGTLSSLSGSTFGIITSPGGQGGENCKFRRGSVGSSGEASVYGPGGAGGNMRSSGQLAPLYSYGAGGGGGGGDSVDSVFGIVTDNGGRAGEGGKASSRMTGLLQIRYGTVLTTVVGSGGPTNTFVYDGGAGANGFASIDVDGTITTYSFPNTYTMTV